MQTDRTRPIRILLVQDPPVPREFLHRLLGGAYELQTVASCAEARLVASSAEGAPDVVVADVRQVDGDGVELLAELQTIHGCRTIAMTDDDDDAPRCRRAGIDRTVPRPLPAIELQALMILLVTRGETN
jgi:DNA-binding response OmpR family regulator